MAAAEGNRLLTHLLAFLGGVTGALLGWILTGLDRLIAKLPR